MNHAEHCTDPHHHVRDAKAFVKAVEAACKTRGLNLTQARSNALQLIAESDKPIKAYDLLEGMKKLQDTAAPPTVYRALEFLTEHGFVHRLESINAYLACHHPGGEEHATPFLICDNCQTTQELEQPKWVEELENQAMAMGFNVRAQTLELHGLCAACQKADRAK